jgi:hypothetical protein
MPIDLSALAARSRMVCIDGIGELVFREPTLADYQRAQHDPNWWVDLINCADGSPFLANPKDAGKIRGDLAGLLLEEATKIRPTEPPSGGSGESRARSSA